MAIDVRESLTAKVGPLPAWAWGLGLGGAIIAFRAYRNRQVDPEVTEEVAAELAADDLANSASELATGAYGAGLAGVPAPSANPGGWVAPSHTTNPYTAPADNAQWLAQAVPAIVAVTPQITGAQVAAALGKVLAGEPTTTAERNLYDRAVAALGLPPNGTPAFRDVPVTPTQTPPTTPGTPSAAPVTWRARYGQTVIASGRPSMDDALNRAAIWVKAKPRTDNNKVFRVAVEPSRGSGAKAFDIRRVYDPSSGTDRAVILTPHTVGP